MLLDVNILLKGLNEGNPDYPRINPWLRNALDHADGIAVPWHSSLGFLRIATKVGLLREAIPFEPAWELIDNLLGHPKVWIPMPTTRHAELFHTLMQHTPQTPAWISDAHLAALAIEHNLTLVSTDGGFTRFPGLRFLNPLSVA